MTEIDLNNIELVYLCLMSLLLVFIFFLIVWVIASVVRVPHGHVCVVEHWGRFKGRILSSGVHVVPWPMQTIHYVKWSYINEDSLAKNIGAPESENDAPTSTTGDAESKASKLKSRRKMRTINETGFLIDTRERSIDSMPVQCRSKDNILVVVNGTLLYRIEDVATAVYKIDNALGYLCDCVVQATRATVAENTVMDLQDSMLASSILRSLQGRCGDKGVEIRDFIIQGVQFNDALIMDNAKQMKKVEFERETARMKHQARTEEMQYELEQQRQANGLRLQRIEAENREKALEAKQIADRYRTLIEVGLTHKDIVQLEQSKNVADAIHNFKGQTLLLGTTSSPITGLPKDLVVM